jgi:hypothetical protein
MKNATLFFLAAAVAATSSFAQTGAKIEFLKEEPTAGSVPYRKVVHVDDGSYATGQVKEITGGNRALSIPRGVRCVKRPGTSSASTGH